MERFGFLCILQNEKLTQRTYVSTLIQLIKGAFLGCPQYHLNIICYNVDW